MPRISFVGHLAGLLIGILQAYGCLGFLFPPRAWVNRLEASPCCSPFARCGQYVLAPEASDRDRNALCAALGSCFGGGSGGSSSGGTGGGGGSSGGFLGSPGRRARNFGGGVTGTASTASSPSAARPPVATAVPVASTAGVGVGLAGGESPHSRAAGTDGRGWRLIEDNGAEEEEDLEGGRGYPQGAAQGPDGQQRRIVL